MKGPAPGDTKFVHDAGQSKGKSSLKPQIFTDEHGSDPCSSVKSVAVTALLLDLFVRADPLEMNAAIRRHGLDGRSTRTEIERNLLCDWALNSYREVNTDASVYGPSLEIG